MTTPRRAFLLTVAVLLSATFVTAQIATEEATNLGFLEATHFGLVTQADPGSGTRSYLCWRWASNQTSNIGCSDHSLGASPGRDTFMFADFENDSDREFVSYRTGTDPLSPSVTSVFGFFPWMPLTINFGLGMDDPTVLGDYTGDGKTDIAIFRCNPNDPVGTQCYFIYRLSEIGLHAWIPWGTVYAPGKADIPAPGDYDGDGKYDAAIRRPLDPANPNGTQIFYVRRSSDGAFVYFDFGLGSDKFISGDFDGDFKTDLCAVRNTQNEGMQLRWFIKYSSTGTWAWNVPFGLGRSGEIGDYLAPGDYNADGRLDITIWRRQATNVRTEFYILPSTSTPGVFAPITYAQFDPCSPGPCLYPVTQFLVH